MEMYHPIGGKQAIKERKKERTVLAEKPVEKGKLMGGNLAAEKEKNDYPQLPQKVQFVPE